MKEQKQETVVQYLEALSSKSPIPGGGGAAALAAAFAFSLGLMVGNLTLGKKKYADFQEELEGIMKDLEEAKQKAFVFEARDEEVFLPLSQAYSLPRGTEEEHGKGPDRGLLGTCRTFGTLYGKDSFIFQITGEGLQNCSVGCGRWSKLSKNSYRKCYAECVH